MGTVKPNVNRAWANSAGPGNITNPGNAKYDSGWDTIGEKPLRQHMNYILNRADEFEKHVNEYGICQWDAITSYSIHSIVQTANGKLFKSLQNINVNNDPELFPAFWAPLLGGGVIYYGISTGTNTYSVTIPGITSITEPLFVLIKNGNTNTSGTCTLNINGLGAQSIKLSTGEDSKPGDMLQDAVSILVFRATNFQLINPNTVTSGTGVFYGTSTGTNTYAATISGITSITEPLFVLIKNGNTNTSGVCSLNINGLGDFAITLATGGDIKSGDMLQNGVSILVFRGATFQLLNPNTLLSGVGTFYGTSSGTNTYTVSIDGITALYEPLLIFLKNGNANTSETCTLNVNSLGAVPIKLSTDEDIFFEDMPQDGVSILIYDGTNFQLLNPAADRMKLLVTVKIY
jgi:hypothetical protein